MLMPFSWQALPLAGQNVLGTEEEGGCAFSREKDFRLNTEVTKQSGTDQEHD